MSNEQRLQSTIYLSNLAPQVNPSIIHSHFIPFGEITDISFPKPDLPPGTAPPPPGVFPGHRGFGYIEFESEEDAKEAIDNMDRSELFGRVIRVAKAKPMTSVGEGLGSKTAVWEQEGYLASLGAESGSGTGIMDVEVAVTREDPMMGLEGLDVAGPQRA